MDIESN